MIKGKRKMNLFSLSGKLAVVTGSGGGIGREIAIQFSNAGANLAIIDINKAGLQETAMKARKSGGNVVEVVADLTEFGNIRNIVESIITKAGKIDILVNNAGVIVKKYILDASIEDWETIFKQNVFSYSEMAKQVGKTMVEKGGGNIINMASVTAFIAMPERGLYAASKAAIVQLTRHIAVELGPKGIRCNAICPGPIETEINRQWKKMGADYSFVEKFPIGRLGKPEEVAGVALFLASNASSYVTGTTITVDGGMTAI